jgi:hypothetical protein
MDEAKRAFENGQRVAQLAAIKEDLSEIKGSLSSLAKKLDAHLLTDSGVRTQLKVLWAAAGLYGVTIISLALKVVLG